MSIFGPFRNPVFRLYWATALAANFGWLIQVVGVSWAMTERGASAQMVSLVQSALSAPMMFFALFAGALADRFGRKTMVLWSQSFLFAVSSLLALAAFMGWVGTWGLLAFTFLIGAGKAFHNPAWQTLVSEFTPQDDLPQAIALNSMGFNLARSLGPAIGGALVAVFGAFAAFCVNAVSNILMIFVVLRWKFPARAPNSEPIGAMMRAGVRFVARTPVLARVIARASLFNFAAIAPTALLPLIARDLLAGGPATYGLLLGSYGLGAVGGVGLAGMMQRIGLEGRARTGFLLSALAILGVGLSPWQGVTMLALAGAGAAWLLSLSAYNSTVQLGAPAWAVSRCHAIYQSCAFAANALGAVIWGALAERYGLRAALALAALALIGGAALGLVMRLHDPEPRG